jgi:hypothetical protein
MKTHRKLLAAAGLIAALALAGCLGGGNDAPLPPTASTEVPDSAGVSTAAFVSFILSLSGSDETSAPLTIKDTFTVPADETAPPTPLT